MTRGGFITLEGIEGAGKSSQLGVVRAALERAGYEVVVTREPGGTPFSERIRDLVLLPGREAVPALAELLLMLAARAVHVERLIRPAVERGAWVVCDRFTDATLAYQGGGRGLSGTLIRELADAIHGDLWPDLTLLLDVAPEVGLARASRRGASDRFEQEDAVFFERVRAAYLALARAEPERIAVVDAGGPATAVSAAIEAQIAAVLERHRKNVT